MADHQPSSNKENQSGDQKTGPPSMIDISPPRDKSNEPEHQSDKPKSPDQPPSSASDGTAAKEKTPVKKDKTPEPLSPKKTKTPEAPIKTPEDENRKPDDSKNKSPQPAAAKTPASDEKAKSPSPKKVPEDSRKTLDAHDSGKGGQSPAAGGGDKGGGQSPAAGGGDKSGGQSPAAGGGPSLPDKDEADKKPKYYVSDDVMKTKDVIGLRPSQDNTFDDNFVVKSYAPQTKKDPAAVIVEPRTDTATPAVVISEPAKLTATVEKSTEKKSDHEKTPEVLEFDESDVIIDEPDTLDPEEKKVLNDTKPVVEGFMSGYHRTLEEGGQPLQATTMRLSVDQTTQTDRTPSPCIPLFHQELLSPASQVGKQLSQIAVTFDAQYRPVVKTLVDQWLLDLRRINADKQPAFRLVWESFKKIVQEVFREGVTWSRILILMMFVYEVFVHLYTMYVPKTAQSFLRCFLKSLVGFGVTRWVAKNGGWSVATVGVMHEQTMSHPSTSVPSLHPPPGNDLMHQPVVLAAGVGAIVAGVAYWLFKK